MDLSCRLESQIESRHKKHVTVGPVTVVPVMMGPVMVGPVMRSRS
jgi:hypothetical protein